MSDFVKNLVHRAVGLPQPVAIHPAVVPSQMPAVAPTPVDLESPQDVMSTPAIALGVHDQSSDIARSGFSALAESAPRPVPQPTSAPETVRHRKETLSAKTEETTRLLRPRSDPAPTPAVASQIQREDDSSPRVVNDLRALPPLGALAATVPVTRVNLERHTPPLERDTPPMIVCPDPKPRSDTASAPVPDHSLSKAEFIAVASIQPAPTAAPSTSRERALDSRGIQVKIGKVEIRSSQPAPVVRPNRPLRTSGFDDLRMARTYLDRGSH